MKTISVRGIDEKTAAKLKEEAQRQGKSVNSLIVQLIQRGVGLRPQRVRHQIYDDLDPLAGTWSEKDEVEFLDAVSDFEEIDKGLWDEANIAGH